MQVAGVTTVHSPYSCSPAIGRIHPIIFSEIGDVSESDNPLALMPKSTLGIPHVFSTSNTRHKTSTASVMSVREMMENFSMPLSVFCVFTLKYVGSNSF